jgi:hypothetical protein
VINQASLSAVAGAPFGSDGVRPLYESYCFANIPSAVVRLFDPAAASALPADVFGDAAGGSAPQKVVVLLMDALGWRFVAPRLERHPLLKRFVQDGVVSQLTSQFPSTTAAHITTIHTGQAVNHSGICEWTYYEPLIGRMFLPLRFKVSTEREQENDLDSADLGNLLPLIPAETLYEQLAARGVTSHIHMPSNIVSVYNSVVFRGAEQAPFDKFGRGLQDIAQQIKQAEGKHYHFIYESEVDTICHRYGPTAAATERSIERMLMMVEEYLVKPLLGSETLLLITADHGQIDIDPQTVVWLDEPRFAPLLAWSERDANGQPRKFGGSCRDCLLYIRPEHQNEAVRLLRRELEGVARVYPIETLYAQNIFGADYSARLQERMGTVVVLPLPGQAVWWREGTSFEYVAYRGFHGGLTRDEMEIPFMTLRV